MGELTLLGGGLLVHLVMWNSISYLCHLDSRSTPLSAKRTTYCQVSPGGRIVPRWNLCPKFKVTWSLMFYPRHSTADLPAVPALLSFRCQLCLHALVCPLSSFLSVPCAPSLGGTVPCLLLASSTGKEFSLPSAPMQALCAPICQEVFALYLLTVFPLNESWPNVLLQL